jgi:hypothetical protein
VKTSQKASKLVAQILVFDIKNFRELFPLRSIKNRRGEKFSLEQHFILRKVGFRPTCCFL